MLSYFLISLICAIGMAIVFVEKRFEWPVKFFNVLFRKNIRKINKKLTKLALCSICLSFWTCLISDLVLLFISGFSYFLWPLSGFAAAGIVWTIYELLSAIEKRV